MNNNVLTDPVSLAPQELRTAHLVDSVFALLGVDEEASPLDGTSSDGCSGVADAEQALPWVLSVEDDDDVALLLKMRLQKMGVNVLRATAGIEGYRRANSTKPSAIILDYELPGGNGDYVLRRLKANQATHDIPVIILTGSSEPYVEQKMRMLGAAEFLSKPLDWPKLQNALECWIPNLKTGLASDTKQNMRIETNHVQT